MSYKNQCKITPSEDMNEGAAKKWYRDTGSLGINFY